MPSIYKYYNTSDSSYTFSLINKPVSSNKKTRIYLGDTTNEIYADASNQLNITSNLDIEQSLNVTTNLTAGGQLSIGYTSNPSPNYNLLAKNNKVAINKSDTNASYTLDIGGSTKIDNDLYVSGTTTLAGTFNVNGNFNVSTDKFQVNATTGNATLSGDLTVNGNTYLGNQTTDTTTVSGNLVVSGAFLGRVPLGGIIPLVTGYFINPSGGVNTGNTGTFTSVSGLVPTSGTITDDGFLYCNGALIPTTANSLLASISGGEQRYTPDLTDSRFLQGSTSSGTIGGSNSVTLATTNLPVHDHTINHSHTSSTGNNGSHTHNIIQRGAAGNANTNSPKRIAVDTTDANGTTLIVESIESAGDHNHSISISYSGSSGTTGSGTAFDVRPKYMNVVYVMRVK